MVDNAVNAQASLGLSEQKPEHKALGAIIGKWINEGQTVPTPDAPAQKIVTSDIYEWGPGGTYVIHSAYGRLGGMDVGGIEVMTYDAAQKKYMSHFFDGQGNYSADELEINGDTWKWHGKETGCTAIFTENGKIQTAHHVRLDENGKWVPAMEVILTRVA